MTARALTLVAMLAFGCAHQPASMSTAQLVEHCAQKYSSLALPETAQCEDPSGLVFTPAPRTNQFWHVAKWVALILASASGG